MSVHCWMARELPERKGPDWPSSVYLAARGSLAPDHSVQKSLPESLPTEVPQRRSVVGQSKRDLLPERPERHPRQMLVALGIKSVMDCWVEVRGSRSIWKNLRTCRVLEMIEGCCLIGRATNGGVQCARRLLVCNQRLVRP